MEDEIEEGDTSPVEDVVKEARSMGWIPKENFRGDTSRWVDAEEFVRRGKEVLPILRNENSKLLGRLDEANRRIEELKNTVDGQSKTVRDLLEHQATEIRRQVEDKLKALRVEKKEAIRSGDHDRAADLEEEIDEVKDRMEKAKKPQETPEPPQSTSAKIEPWAAEFAEENKDWLNKDKRKTAAFLGICDDILESTGLRGKALLEKAKGELDELFTPAKPRTSKTEGGSVGGSSRSSSEGGSTRFSDLPSEAQVTCKRQAHKYVGPEGSGKAFKTEAEWQKFYTDSYFASSRS